MHIRDMERRWVPPYLQTPESTHDDNLPIISGAPITCCFHLIDLTYPRQRYVELWATCISGLFDTANPTFLLNSILLHSALHCLWWISFER